ncbi:hypothetical protein BEL04_09585 [Mucilaginibacter sp. PPCGB 2223]|uniref:WD40/YVTN/BNR-like repeat-containing protein n=1 Tax=Mucilaginibacter sp. PPCGB 2223 TaxID=1886027 RepID=UPI0008262866|nr:hypothetical protein [Mucilaginibacter sp. PPCGB 2223]OCX54480.1 hypothetical protein BEL04_09585 [Mucilaginibacter sp. PPCGB 2223]
MNKRALKFFICFFIAGIGLTACHKTPITVQSIGPTLQWARVTNLPADNFTALGVFNNVVYVASSTSDRIYESADNGITWTATAPVSSGKLIFSLIVYQNKLFVGTDYEIYSSSDNGKTWIGAGNNTMTVNSFAVWNNSLYAAAIDNSGQGLLKLNATGQWAPFQNGLTNAVRASKVLVANNYFVAGTTDFFAAYDQTQQLWQTKQYVDITKTRYKNTPFPNLVIDMINTPASILAQIYVGNNDHETILRSDDAGLTMNFDTVGLKADTSDDKFLMCGMYVGNNKMYSIIDQQQGTKGIWLQSRDQNAVLGTTWANGEEFLPGLYGHGLTALTDVLFLATDNGLYYKKAH